MMQHYFIGHKDSQTITEYLNNMDKIMGLAK